MVIFVSLDETCDRGQLTGLAFCSPPRDPAAMRWSLMLLLGLALVSAAQASKPVEANLVGCVVGGAFYSVEPTIAYRISLPSGLDVAPFEGKQVSMHGKLMPGDRFVLADGEQPQVKAATCPAKALRLIKHNEVVDLRVAATRAAADGDHAAAADLIARAMATLSPPSCDTFTDRAHILVLAGDLAAARKDLAVIKAHKKCSIDRRMNPLLLQDLGNLLRDKGDRRAAVTALQLALAACDGDWCRPDIKKDLATAKQP